MQRLYLQRHVYACSVPEIVLLDLKANRYLAIPAQYSPTLARWVEGWPGARGAEQTPSTEESGVTRFVETLLAQNILTTVAEQGKPATAVMPDVPQRTLIPQPELIPTSKVSTWQRARRRLPAMLYAAMTAKIQLRRHPIEKIVASVAARKQRTRGAGQAPTTELVEDFYWLRPLVFSGQLQCLFHSLTLLNYLARFGVHPHWIFAVRSTPFGAHCWVQNDATVFNDTLERVALFTPIMVV